MNFDRRGYGESMNEMYGTVESVEWLNPSMLRVVFGGEGLDSYEPTEWTDEYVNALFLPDDSSLTVPFDMDTLPDDQAQRPRGRRFTIRRWNDADRQLVIDFVAHGDVGFAGRWAQQASVGDRLQMMPPGGGYRPSAEADWHLLVGDESALPAIGASLEALPAGTPSVAVVIIDDADHEIELPTDSDLELHWVHRCVAADPDTALLEAVEKLDWRSGTADVFVHGEAGEVRAVRRHLLAERGVSKEGSSISPYWRRDHTDEAWRQVKRQWIMEQAADV